MVETPRPRFLFLLSAAYRRVQQEAKRGSAIGAARSGLLVAIAADGAGTPMADVGHSLDLAGSSLTELVDRAVERGLMIRRAQPRDGRACDLILTDQGRAARADAVRRIRAMNDRACAGFTDAELAVVARWLDAVRSRFPLQEDGS